MGPLAKKGPGGAGANFGIRWGPGAGLKDRQGTRVGVCLAGQGCDVGWSPPKHRRTNTAGLCRRTHGSSRTRRTDPTGARLRTAASAGSRKDWGQGTGDFGWTGRSTLGRGGESKGPPFRGTGRRGALAFVG